MLCSLCVFSMLTFLVVGFPVSQAPCFASWSHSELETYALAAWSSSVHIPISLDTTPCPSASVKHASIGNELQRESDMNIPAEVSMEDVVATDPATSSALMTLYDSTNGPSWSKSYNWGNTSQSACRWYGVCCNATAEEFYHCPNPNWASGVFTGSCCTPSGIVTNINLIENNLLGTIPSALSQLNDLQSLYLGYNQLRGTIPSQLGQLSALTTLDLFSNQLRGSIPSELGQLSAMIRLDLFWNKLSGTIPPELGQLSALEELSLSYNQLSGTIPSELEQLSALESLSLAYNQLSGTIPSELGQLSALNFLGLSNNQLSGTIPSELGQLSSLAHLVLSVNQLSGTIPSELGQLSVMEGLGLDTNQLSGTIPSELGQLSALAVLALEKNQLDGSIPSELGQLSALALLALAENQLSGSIPSELGQLSVMEHLFLSSNQLSGTIPVALGSLSALTEAKLSHNRISGTIPFELQELSSLTSLDLSDNRLEGSIPAFLVYSNTLTSLNMASNGFSGTIPESSLKNTSLQLLELSNNTLSGTIPMTIFEMPKLKTLKLGGNLLQGELLDSLHRCMSYSLSVVDLKFNQLGGSLSFFQSFSELTLLNIRQNAFNGSVELLPTKASPDGNGCAYSPVISVLTHMDVSYNSFSELGTLPSSVTTFTAARCALSGPVAPLGVLTSASFIDVHDNPNLTGEIPSEIAASKFLLYLYVTNTSMQSAKVGYSPGLNLDSSEPQTFGTGDNRYECPVVHSEASENAFLSISPFYFSYSGCYCGVGFSGPHVDNGVASCKRCSPGTYNGKEENTACSKCPPSTYSRTKGSLQCTSCALPLKLVINDGTKCIDLTAFYVLSLLFIIILVSVLLTLSIALAASVAVGYHLLKAWRARELRHVTLLIQKRARDEIPADLLIRYRDLKMETVIGAGSFARVYKGKWNHTLVAIKELTGVHTLMATLEAERNVSISEADSQQDEGIQKLVNEFRSEVLVMSRLHHPNVLLLVGACSEFPNLCIVTEFLPNGALYDVLHKKNARDTITQKQQMQWLLETVSGMAYLHEQGLMHRDLKSLNVLLDDLNRAKLCDFGLAKIVGDAQRTMTSGVGSLLWMSPEVVRGEPYSFSADVYSWGIMAWEIMSPEEILFPGMSSYEVAKQIVAGHRPKVDPAWSYCVCQLMRHCWSDEKESRPTFVEVMLQLEAVIQPEAKEEMMRGDGNDMGLTTPLLQT
jgi:Leucine-rich repeat (LRR) protein